MAGKDQTRRIIFQQQFNVEICDLSGLCSVVPHPSQLREPFLAVSLAHSQLSTMFSVGFPWKAMQTAKTPSFDGT
jgi:hypothetical protein